MSYDFVLISKGLGKCYQIYDRPIDRLKQSFWRGRKHFFREFWALRDVSFNIRKGETVGIIGSNGAGKSTLLQVICGVLRPTVGRVTVNAKVAALLELGAGFNKEFTGRENIYINASVLGLTQSEIDARIGDIIGFADIGQFIDQPVKNYSSGMYVRLAFAIAIHVSPDILIIDEALAVGDVRFQHKCMAKIKEFCAKGTVVFVSHNTSAVKELCSRVIWLDSGRIRMEGQPKYVIEKYLQFMYEGETEDKRARSKTSVSQNGVSETEGVSLISNRNRQFGNLKAVIKGVRLSTPEGHTNVLNAGQSCQIDIFLQAHTEIHDPIVGFSIKDRLGREIYGDNNLLMGQIIPALLTGQEYLVSFKISSWANIAEDDYLLTVAIAEGSMEDHKQCHYVHDALVFRSVPVRKAVGILLVADIHMELSHIKEEVSPGSES